MGGSPRQGDPPIFLSAAETDAISAMAAARRRWFDADGNTAQPVGVTAFGRDALEGVGPPPRRSRRP